jgi:hypothetical protein
LIRLEQRRLLTITGLGILFHPMHLYPPPLARFFNLLSEMSPEQTKSQELFMSTPGSEAPKLLDGPTSRISQSTMLLQWDPHDCSPHLRHLRILDGRWHIIHAPFILLLSPTVDSRPNRNRHPRIMHRPRCVYKHFLHRIQQNWNFTVKLLKLVKSASFRKAV